MRLRHGTPVVRASFDDPNLVSCAGLEPVMRLAEAGDLPGHRQRPVGPSLGADPGR